MRSIQQAIVGWIVTTAPGVTARNERVGGDQELLHGVAADQMLVDDSLEHGRIAPAVPRPLGMTTAIGPPSRCAGSWRWSGECRRARRDRAPSTASSEIRPQGAILVATLGVV
jgi:hypothetical protein